MVPSPPATVTHAHALPYRRVLPAPQRTALQVKLWPDSWPKLELLAVVHALRVLKVLVSYFRLLVL
jgi:hypothetical protein